MQVPSQHVIIEINIRKYIKWGLPYLTEKHRHISPSSAPQDQTENKNFEHLPRVRKEITERRNNFN